MFVDGQLIAGAWTNWTKGRIFFEEGCDEVVGTVDLEAGCAHQVVAASETPRAAICPRSSCPAARPSWSLP
ncbi:MAG: hypothetical protein MO846_00025 [Candidatus Devosia symbiotica]|nr:hypothetical protein [Candidatus Devosia symbiotica]